mgnify:CR=1 FL=1
MNKLFLSLIVVLIVLLGVFVYADSDMKFKKSDGSTYDVKVLPEEAVKNAFSTEVENVEIDIEEKVNSDIPKVVYKVNADTEGKFLGIFKIRSRYEASIDVNTGDVLEWKGPWWAFLITGKPAKPEIKDVQEDNSIEDEDIQDDSGSSSEGDQTNPPVIDVVGDSSENFAVGASGVSGAPRRASNVAGNNYRSVNSEECAQIGGEMKTECGSACRTYCDFSGISNKEEKCASINGVWHVTERWENCDIIVEPLTEESRCIASKGKWMQGQTGEWFCNKATEDAGESCWHNGQCESICIAPEGTFIGQTNVRGNCYEYKISAYECRSQVISGVVVPVACA